MACALPEGCPINFCVPSEAANNFQMKVFSFHFLTLQCNISVPAFFFFFHFGCSGCHSIWMRLKLWPRNLCPSHLRQTFYDKVIILKRFPFPFETPKSLIQIMMILMRIFFLFLPMRKLEYIYHDNYGNNDDKNNGDKNYTDNVQCTYIRSFSLLNLEQNTSYSFLMTCSDRQDNLWTSEKINFDTGVFVYQQNISHITKIFHASPQ